MIVKQVLLTAPMEMYGEQYGENACSYTATIRRGGVMKNDADRRGGRDNTLQYLPNSLDVSFKSQIQ